MDSNTVFPRCICNFWSLTWISKLNRFDSYLKTKRKKKANGMNIDIRAWKLHAVAIICPLI